MQSINKVLVLCTALVLLSGCEINMLANVASFTNLKSTENKVQIHGDSIFDLSGDIQKELSKLSSKVYKEVSSSGARADEIRANFEKLPADEKLQIKTLIIDGAINDLMKAGQSEYWVKLPGFTPVKAQFECFADDNSSITRVCNDAIELGISNMQSLLVTIEATNVEHIVMLGYLTPQGVVARLSAAVNQLNERLATLCEFSVVPCIFIDTSYKAGDDLVAYQAQVNVDGLHPSQLGSAIRAQKIWQALLQAGAYR